MLRRFQWLLLTVLIALVIAIPALAQDAAAPAAPAAGASGGGGGTSFFQQFFLSDDILGLIIIWVLLTMSALSIGFSMSLFLKFRRNAIVPGEAVEAVEAMIAGKQFREAIEYVNNDGTYLSQLVAAAMGEASAGYNAMERAIQEESDYETAKMLRPVEYLNVVGNIAPMLGLFGTVYGMILAFQQLVAAGGKPDPAALAAGISTALVTTFWGLVVAMPALAVYALIRNKIDALTSEGVVVAADLIRPFKPGAKKAPKKD